MNAAREIEIKLRLDPAQVETFATAELVRRSKMKRTRMQAAYYDHRNWKLAKHAMELRVRAQGAAYVQTVKAGNGFNRGEWETEVANQCPSISDLQNTPAAKVLKKRTRLKQVFTTEVDRRTWLVCDQDSTVEISLDSGMLISGDRSEPIAEAEFELKDGPPDVLFYLARKAIEHCDASVSFVGKAFRGQRLAAGRERRAEHNLDLRIRANASACEAFEEIMTACLRQLSVDEEILRSDPDNEEGVHQMRVAVRRLRAALSLFEALIDGEQSRLVAKELKWISDLLGAARDFDVLTSKLLKRATLQHPEVEGIAELLTTCAAAKRDAHRRLSEGLHALRFRNLLLSTVELIHLNAWRSDDRRRAVRDRQFREVAEQELNRRLKKVRARKNLDTIQGTDERARHEIRIRAKKLRYMGEFLRPVTGRKAVDGILKRLNAMQDKLGTLHDAVAAEQLLSKSVTHDPKLAFAAAIVAQTVRPPADAVEHALTALRKLRKSGCF